MKIRGRRLVQPHRAKRELRSELASVVAAAAMFALTACHSPAYTPPKGIHGTDLVGSWIGPSDAFIDLRSDGEVSVEKLTPPLLFGGPGGIDSGTGRWTFYANWLQDQGPALEIHLDRWTGAHTAHEDVLLRVESSKTIFAFVGDPDQNQRITFHRQGSGGTTSNL